jgi:transmembrane sensor
MSQPEIDFDPVSTDSRRDKSERAVLARLAAIQALGESDAVIAPPAPRWRWAVGFGAVALAAALILFLVIRRVEHVNQVAEAPSLIVTPVGGSSRFTVADAVIDAGGDTSVEVKREAGGATALLLSRGSVDCDVAPKPGRAPFRVHAGDVTVEVVGTRFSVTRHGASVRVDVTRGKVRVKSQTEERLLEAGASWTPGLTAATDRPASEQAASARAAHEGVVAADPPVTEADPIETPADDATEPAPSAPRQSSRAEFAAAQRLEAKHPTEAARAYRTIANGKDVWAALALYSLAEVDATGDAAAALRDLDELGRRFPRGANAEDAAWLRVTVLRKLGRDADARKAAAAYLRQYPNGTYVTAAERLTSP